MGQQPHCIGLDAGQSGQDKQRCEEGCQQEETHGHTHETVRRRAR
jgi:hypothetical protein